MKFYPVLMAVFFTLAGCGYEKSCPDCKNNCQIKAGDDKGHCPAPGDCPCNCGDGCECPTCDEGTKPFAASVVSPWELTNMNLDPSGMYRSSDFSNGIFVIENYFLSCPYCNDNAPAVNAFAAAYVDQPAVQVIDLGIDRNDTQYQTWISRHTPNHAVLKDSDRVLTNQLGTRGYPSTYVVDCHLNVVYSHTGTWDSQATAELKNEVDSLLASPCYLTLPTH